MSAGYRRVAKFAAGCGREAVFARSSWAAGVGSCTLADMFAGFGFKGRAGIGHCLGRGAMRAAPLLLAFACGDDADEPSTVRNPPGGSMSEAGVTDADAAVTEGTGDTDVGATSDSSESQSSNTTATATSTSTDRTTGIIPIPTAVPTTTSAVTAPTTTSSSMPPVPDIDWMPVDNPPEGLTECQDNLEAPDDGSCTYRLSCKERQLWANCVPGEDGQWQCFCLNYGSGQSYEYGVTGADQQTACQAGITFCNPGRTPPLSEPVCDLVQETSYPETCTRSRDCVATAALPGGATGHVVSEGESNNCQLYDNKMICRCGSYYRPFWLYGTDGTHACEYMDGICSGDVPVGEGSDCEGTSLSVEQSSCYISRSCGLRTELDPQAGVYALSDFSQASSSCYLYNGTASCSCNNPNGGYFSLTLGGVEPLDACYVTDGLCTQGQVVEITGSLDCGSLSVSASDATKTCSANATCGQEGIVDGTAVTLQGPIGTDCQAADNGTDWTCSCRSGNSTSAPFGLSGTKALDVCKEATTQCSERATTLQFNTYGGAEYVFGDPPVQGDAGVPQ